MFEPSGSVKDLTIFNLRIPLLYLGVGCSNSNLYDEKLVNNITKFIRPKKYFMNTWLRKWDWDITDLRNALYESYKKVKIGNKKYEAYTRYRSKYRTKKIIYVEYEDEILIITGTEGV